MRTGLGCAPLLLLLLHFKICSNNDGGDDISSSLYWTWVKNDENTDLEE